MSTTSIPLDEPSGGIPELTHDDINAAITVLASGSGPFAVDTERAMGIRYSPRAYLVQLKRADSPIVLIDPVGIEDKLSPLAKAMDTEWILHSAEQDLPSLRELGLEPARIFDTEMAGLILGFEHTSLQSMIDNVLHIHLAKEHSNSDWSMRPLPPELRAYAALDVELLHDLRDALIVRLNESGRFEWFEQESEAIRDRRPAPPPLQPWRKIARQNSIKDRRSLAMVEELWLARDSLAKTLDLAPGKVLPNAVLGELAVRKPRSFSDIASSPGVSRESSSLSFRTISLRHRRFFSFSDRLNADIDRGIYAIIR